MANFILRSNKALHHVLGLFCLLLLVHKGAAYQFVVGGQKGWNVPSDSNSNPYNQWAEKNRFRIGDSIVFNYQSGQDSVLLVKSEDYSNCNTDAPIAKYTDGHTVVKLNQSGPHFFISGNKDNCLKHEKLVVTALADRSNRSSNNNQTTTAYSPTPSGSTETPSPAPAGQEILSPAPARQEILSPAPAGQETPPPSASSPEGTKEINPTPAPVSEPPPPNGASSILVSFAGLIGAFMVASLVLPL